MAATIPFRVKPRVVEPEALAAKRYLIRLAEHQTERVLAQIQALARPTPELLHLIHAHPDERISIKAIKRWAAELREEDREKFYFRGLRTCEAENIVWHPIFDALARNHGWPTKAMASRTDQTHLHSSIEVQIQTLIPWIENQTDARALERLLDFQLIEITRLVAAHTRVFADVLVQRLPFDALAQNPRLPTAWALHLAEQAILEIENAGARHALQHTINSHSPFPSTSKAFTTIESLARAGHPIPSKLIDRMIEATSHTGWEVRCSDALVELGTQVNEEQLDRMFLETNDEAVICNLLKHPSGTSAWRQKILGTITGSRLSRFRRLASKDPVLLADKAVRACILNTNSDLVLKQALRAAGDLDAGMFKEILDRCLARMPSYVASAVPMPIYNGEAWRERIRKEFLEYVIEYLVQRNDLYNLLCLSRYEPAAQNPKLQRMLIAWVGSEDSELITWIAPYARGDNFRLLFHRFTNSAYHFEKFIKIILEQNRESLSDLQPEDIRKALQSENKNVRFQILSLLPQIKAPTIQGQEPKRTKQSKKKA